MQFPQRNAMTAVQRALNSAAAEELRKGAYYRFDPPIRATAIPTGGPNTCALAECEFDRGCYLGFIDENHVFQGKPVNDSRIIPTPPGHADAPNLDEIREQLRDSYFPVLFIGGVPAVLDTDQSHR